MIFEFLLIFLGLERKVLLLDLDETLIHAEDYQLGVSYDFKIELNTIYDDGYEEVAEVRKTPNCQF